jgi:predicted GNAT superfamily acetyltransferase
MSERSVRIAPASDPRDLESFVDVYRRTFRYDESGLNVRLLRALRLNGGVVIGAWVDGEPAGLVFGFVAQAPGIGYYHYSQVAAVEDRFQGLGIGRLLKLAQRDQVLAQDLHRMRWYFDPLRSRSAHFNLDVLGAEAVAVERDLYGPGHGRDEGFPTHRLVAEWALDAPPSRVDLSAPAEGTPLISVPEHLDAYRTAHPDEARALAEEVARSFTSAFELGLRAVAMRRADGWAHYVLRQPR